MAKKKNGAQKPANKEAIHVKIAGALGTVAGEIMNTKDHLVEMAGGAIDSLKSTIQNITTKKKTAVKKAAPKKAAPKKTPGTVAKKAAAPAVTVAGKKVSRTAVNKKTSPIKKSPASAVNKKPAAPAKKSSKPAATKKAVPAKKSPIKKAAKKTAVKK